MFAKGYIVFLFYVSGNISFWGKWLKSHIIGTFAPIFPKTKHVFGNYFGFWEIFLGRRFICEKRISKGDVKKSQSQNQNQSVKPTMIYKEAISKN